MSEKVALLLSGGIASTVQLFQLHRRGGVEVHALGFAYGQDAMRELGCALALARDLGVHVRQEGMVQLQNLLPPQPDGQRHPTLRSVWRALLDAWGVVLDARTELLPSRTGSPDVRQGQDLGVPLDRTWSCLAPSRWADAHAVHCGTCPGCANRQRAFLAAGLVDPVAYAGPAAEPVLNEVSER